MPNSPLLGYAELAEAQAIPATSSNRIDRYLEAFATRAIVLDKDEDDPTAASDNEGDAYLVPSGATGAWTGWAESIALMVGGTWRRILPREGLRAYIVDEDTDYEYDGSDWAVVAGLGAPDLDDLNDVDTSSVAAGDGLVFDGTNWVDGSPGARVNAQSGTTYTLVLSDANNVVECTNGSAITLTVPTNASVAFPVGTAVEIHQGGAGTLTIAAAGGVTILSRGGLLDLAGEEAVAAIRKVATNTWRLTGDIS